MRWLWTEKDMPEKLTRLVSEHPLVEVVHEELTEIPREGLVIIATGPLTEGKLGEDIQQFCGGEGFHFYDAAAPIVTEESMDLSVVYKASRYGKGEAAYLNCPMNEEEYHAFREAPIHAETAEVHGFENGKVFEALHAYRSYGSARRRYHAVWSAEAGRTSTSRDR